ncbi:MAG: zinc transporter ZupT [Erysipelotrichaceae bacterium]
MSNIWIAFLFTLLAGLATGIGGLIVCIMKKPDEKFLSFSLGFSAGVMIYVSLTEIFQKALDSLSIVYDARMAMIYTVIAFFAGMLLIALIDHMIPNEINPHEINDSETSDQALLKMGTFTALALAIHNFPEGIATFVTTLQDPTLAVGIVVAIAIHNIPEGIAVAAPIYQATKSKKKAFTYAVVSGLTEPVGAVIGYLVLAPFINETVFGLIFAGAAGIMVYISLDELLPTAEKYGYHHLSMVGLVLGMMLMAVSIVLFL